jgi:ABC-type amino acid transport substrate-binding protein
MPGPANRPTGMDIELLTRIFEEANCKLEFIAGIPSKRQLTYLMDGTLDVQFAASDTPERREFAWISSPYRREIISLFARAGEAPLYPLHNLKEFAGTSWRLLAPYHGWFGAEFEAVSPKLRAAKRMSPYLNSEQGLVMLENHRGDLLLGDYYSFIYTARADNKIEPQPLPFTVNDEAIHLLMSKKSVTSGDVDAINAAIAKLTANGELKKIIRRYELNARLLAPPG